MLQIVSDALYKWKEKENEGEGNQTFMHACDVQLRAWFKNSQVGMAAHSVLAFSACTGDRTCSMVTLEGACKREWNLH